MSEGQADRTAPAGCGCRSGCLLLVLLLVAWIAAPYLPDKAAQLRHPWLAETALLLILTGFVIHAWRQRMKG